MTPGRPTRLASELLGGRQFSCIHRTLAFRMWGGGGAGKESVNIYDLPGKGKCKAKTGPGGASAESGPEQAEREKSGPVISEPEGKDPQAPLGVWAWVSSGQEA